MRDVLLVFVSMILALTAQVARPQGAQCPGKWYLSMGIRTTGEFVCSKPLRSELDEEQQPQITSRIHCTGGARPIVVDYRTVGCQR